MPKVTFDSVKIAVQVSSGTTILEAARLAGVPLESPCNGAGTCGKCKVKLDKASLSSVELYGNHHISDDEYQKGWVLACEARVKADVSVILVPERDHKGSLKILSEGLGLEVKLDSYIKKCFLSDINKTTVYAGENILATESGDTRNKTYGVVVDIGTTTLVASLIDLNSAEELGVVSTLNPQAVYAQDVLSRIKFASEDKGLKILHTVIINEINKMLGKLLIDTSIRKEYVYEIVFSGNTCMLHLAANVNPFSLGKYPYTPAITGGSHINAQKLGLDISERGIAYLPSIISSYVGADITSGVLASQLDKIDGTTLFVDIGTNGEMVIASGGKLSATSTAAGPAFEGMNISCGMRAANGAVEYFDIDDKGSVSIKVIGDSEPSGICGSGLLDIVGELVEHGIINANGKFIENRDDIPKELAGRLIFKEGKTVFSISEKVYLSQKDIRQVQLAKGAVRAGIEYLLQSRDVSAENVDRVLIAGSFGYHLRAESLINIGLLPEEFEGKIDFIGNTSKSGGKAFLLNKACRKDMDKTVKLIEVVELSNYKDFDKVFVKCLAF